MPDQHDEYKDSFDRYRNDINFHMAVDHLFNFAIAYGFTPGELKQIAFVAAIRAEEYARRLQTMPTNYTGLSASESLKDLLDKKKEGP